MPTTHKSHLHNSHHHHHHSPQAHTIIKMTHSHREPTRMDFKTTSTSKHERRVRFADSVGLELASIFLFDLINLATYHRKADQYSSVPSITSGAHSQAERPKRPVHVAGAAAAAGPPAPTIQTSQLHHYYHGSGGGGVNGSTSKSNNLNFNSNSHSNKTITSQSNLSAGSAASGAASRPPSSFSCEFIQPISLLSFKERVKLNKVHLETCQINSTAGHVSVTCTVRVLNCSYDKSVIIRYTTDDWLTHTDSLASYIPASCDGWSDKFTSTFTLTNQVKAFTPGQRIIFCIRYVFDGAHEHWDNNGGLNYSIKMVPQ